MVNIDPNTISSEALVFLKVQNKKPLPSSTPQTPNPPPKIGIRFGQTPNPPPERGSRAAPPPPSPNPPPERGSRVAPPPPSPNPPPERGSRAAPPPPSPNPPPERGSRAAPPPPSPSPPPPNPPPNRGSRVAPPPPNPPPKRGSQVAQTPNPPPKRGSRVASILLGSTIGSILLLLVVICCIMFVIRKRKRNSEMEEEYMEQVPGMPTRFSYEELKSATKDFCKKLGQGGFGSVFEGTLKDGSKVAVKRLEGIVQTKKSFLAEVESIGNIHHVNLVRLRGFCALKSKLLLVYEFMSNRSLDHWIYHGDREHVLNWECRKKIIVDIAKGLAYLHEDCRHKIIHLDIKPQNILLDNNFNAKIADFGMAKLVDRNQAQVMTNMRGTSGYMAPEWLSSIITEKVDVYSFGIVLLEILCGRKNFDRSEPEESWHLLRVFQNAWEKGKLLDMVDKYSDDMQTHCIEVVEMMDVVSWCLQCDFARRPSMTSVIKVLEGVMEVESNLDYNFTDPRLQKTTVEHEADITQLLPSFLSGPSCAWGIAIGVLAWVVARSRCSGCLLLGSNVVDEVMVIMVPRLLV